MASVPVDKYCVGWRPCRQPINISMKVTDILSSNPRFDMLLSECSQFITESGGQPLYRALHNSDDVAKVKVRLKKSTPVNESFNLAFDEQHPNLRQRAVFTTGSLTTVARQDGRPYVVYPIDGFKFMYSTKVHNSGAVYEQILESLAGSLGEQTGCSTTADILKFTYTHEHLQEGIASGAEVVLFNTPYYYAVAATTENVAELSALGIIKP